MEMNFLEDFIIVMGPCAHKDDEFFPLEYETIWHFPSKLLWNFLGNFFGFVWMCDRPFDAILYEFNESFMIVSISTASKHRKNPINYFILLVNPNRNS